MSTSQTRFERVIAAGESVIKLADDFRETEAAQRARASLEQARRAEFRLVVVGEVKRGKSSFISALLAAPDLLPTDDNVATSTVYRLAYGPEKTCRVHFLPEDAEHPEVVPAPRAIAAEELADYGTETGNPDNHKGVDWIGITLPNPILQQGLTIIDTPGLGALFQKHAAITWRYVPNADAVFFVLDSVEAVASRPEMDALARLAELTPFIFFAQTKTDLADPEQWQGWRQRNLEIIAATLKRRPEEIRYFPVSNALKRRADARSNERDLERSGFPPLLAFVGDTLVGAMKERRARVSLAEIAREAAALRRKFDDEARIFAAESVEVLNKREEELKQARNRLDEWRRESGRDLRELRSKLADARLTASHRLQNELDPAPLGPIVGPLVDGVRQSGGSSREMHGQFEALYSRVVDFTCRIAADVQREYDTEIQTIGRLAREEVSRSLQKISGTGTALVTTSSAGPAHSNVHFSHFEEGRTVMTGAAVGLGVASIVFPPLAIVAVLGGLLGGGLARRDYEKRKQEEVLREISSVLSNTVRQAQQTARQELDRCAGRYERIAEDGFANAAAETERDLRGQMDAINEAKQRDRTANDRKAAELRQRVERVDGVLKQIAACLPGGAAQ